MTDLERKRALANARQKKYYAKNKEKVNSNKRAKYDLNKDTLSAESKRRRKEEPGFVERERTNQKKYRETRDPEARAEYMRQWRSDNAGLLLEYNRAYREANRDQVQSWNSARRARIMETTTEKLTVSGILLEHGTDCHICKTEIDLKAPRQPGTPGWEHGLHLDHVLALVNGGTHTLDNVKPAHAVCNLRKWSKSLTDLPTHY